MSDLSSISEDLAAQVKGARATAMLSQQELAQVLGVSMRTIQNWEAGVTFPRPAQRRRLTAFLNGNEAAA